MPEAAAIDVCDSDEDEALARRRAAIRRRRQQAEEQIKETKEDKEADAAPPPPPQELPTGPWDCPACGEHNGEKRLKCNNCGRERPGIKAPAAEVISQPAPIEVDKRKKRGRGWDDWDEQAKKAAAVASAANASLMKDVVNSWKPSVDQLKAMSVAELGPVCKSWKISIEPKEYMRDVMLSKALKVIHGVDS
mmetsp:Transcript_62936/g.147699  ORF Transcript_62936/g.147699 Transcript_62936/m.147699 type:complete len:192 (-) Transcript_62936:41-616(-)